METHERKNTGFKLKVFTDRKSAVIFLACLLLSGVFWVLLSLSEDFQEQITLKVKYINLPNNKVLINPLPSQVNVLVKAEGFKLLGIKTGFSNDQIEVDASSLKFTKQGDFFVSKWISSQHLNELNENGESRITVLNIFPDTIPIEMDEKVSKVLKVQYSGKSSRFPKLKVIGEPKIFPDSVHVVGGKILLKNYKVVYVDSLELMNKEGLVEDRVKLKLPLGTSVEEGEMVKVKYWVEALKPRKLDLVIRATNVPVGEELKLLPGSVELTFLATDTVFKNLSNTDFSVVADYRDLVFSQDKIEIELKRFPEEIELPKISPAKVEYILRK